MRCGRPNFATIASRGFIERRRHPIPPSPEDFDELRDFLPALHREQQKRRLGGGFPASCSCKCLPSDKVAWLQRGPRHYDRQEQRVSSRLPDLSSFSHFGVVHCLARSLSRWRGTACIICCKSRVENDTPYTRALSRLLTSSCTSSYGRSRGKPRRARSPCR